MEKVQFVMLLMKLFVTLQPYIQEGMDAIRKAYGGFKGSPEEQKMHGVLQKMQELVDHLPINTTTLPNTKDVIHKVASAEDADKRGELA